MLRKGKINAYLVRSTLDIDTATAACECAFDTNHSVARRLFSYFLCIINVCLQKVA